MHWKAPLPLLAAPSGAPQLWLPLADETVADAATYELTWALDFSAVMVRLYNVVPVTNVTTLYGRTSGDGGATFDAGASDYQHQRAARGAGLGLGNATADTRFNLTHSGGSNDLNNTAGKGVCGEVLIFNPFAAKQTNIYTSVAYFNAANLAMNCNVQATRKSAARVDALQLFIGTGNISEGRFRSWGLLPHGAGS